MSRVELQRDPLMSPTSFGLPLGPFQPQSDFMELYRSALQNVRLEVICEIYSGAEF